MSSNNSRGERVRRRRMFAAIQRLGGFEPWTERYVSIAGDKHFKISKHMVAPAGTAMLRWRRLTTACGRPANDAQQGDRDSGLCRECIGTLMAKHHQGIEDVDSSRE